MGIGNCLLWGLCLLTGGHGSLPRCSRSSATAGEQSPERFIGSVGCCPVEEAVELLTGPTRGFANVQDELDDLGVLAPKARITSLVWLHLERPVVDKVTLFLGKKK